MVDVVSIENLTWSYYL